MVESVFCDVGAGRTDRDPAVLVSERVYVIRPLRHQLRNRFHTPVLPVAHVQNLQSADPGLLAEELGAIQRRVRKLIWLNPLLGMADYQPVTRGMSAALPYIDIFAPAHNLESLLRLESHLRSA